MGDFTIYGSGKVFKIGEATVTASASTHTKGSYSEIVASLAEDVDGLYVYLSNESRQNYLVDIAIGAAGSEVVIAANLGMQKGGTFDSGKRTSQWVLPLAIPAGTRVSARCQTDAGSGVLSARVFGQGRGLLSKLRPCGTADTAGADTGSSTGTLIDAGAVANTKGSWVEISSGIARSWRGLILNALDVLGDCGEAVLKLDIGVGGSGSEVVLLADLPYYKDLESDNVQPEASWPYPVSIPAGTRIAARLESNSGTAKYRELYLIVVGLS